METSVTVWNSLLVEQTLEKLRMGMPVNMGAFHQSDIDLKADNILYQLTPDEIDEFHKCSHDVIYFVEKYCKFLTDKGRVIVQLRPYQKKILKVLSEEHYINSLDEFGPKNRNIIVLASRQIGKTTTISAFFAWYMCFHNDRNLAILANKQDTAFEIVSKVTKVFKGLPFFLKPGIINIGEGFMRLDNGCMLTSQATTKTAQIGYTIHVLYADEFAHIQANIVDDFWRSIYPTLASSEISQCFITSTPASEYDLFFDIWSKASKGENSFVPIRVDYHEVPGHDASWAEKIKKDFGEEYFAQEFELLFNRGSHLLVSTKDLELMKKIEKEYVFHELSKTSLDESLYRNLKWHPDFDPNQDLDKSIDRFVLSIDTGEGKDEDETKDNDYNICNIFHVQPKSIAQLKKLRTDEMKITNMFRLFQVGLYRDNIKDEENCAKVTRSLVFDQFGADLCKVLIEMNFNGKHFLDKFAQHDEYDDSVVLHTYHTKPVLGDKPPRKKAGFKVGQDKDFFCKLGKILIDNKNLILNEAETTKEFRAFGKDKKGRYRGVGTHDDIAMSALNFSRLYHEAEYEEWLYDLFDNMPESQTKTLMSQMLERYIETSDISDDMFKTMYEDHLQQSSEEVIFRMIEQSNQRGRYTPSSTMHKSMFNVPWKKS